MNFSGEDLEKLRPKLRFKVCYEVGFYCPDVDDIVQETLARFLVASQPGEYPQPRGGGCIPQWRSAAM